LNTKLASTAVKITFLILASFYLLGCRSTTSSPANEQTSSSTKRCSLITKEEAEAALGGEVGVTESPDQNGCSYDLVPGSANGARFGSIVVLVVTSDSPQFEKFGLTEDPRTEATPVSGLGDKAVLFMSRDTPDEGAKAIQILKGKMYVAIGVSASSPPVSVDTLKSLGAKALSRLP